jgi:hypothetical protein
MGSLIAFAAADLPSPVWLLLKSCLSMDDKTRLRTAGAGLLLCQRLVGEAYVAAVAEALGRLVRAAMGSSLNPASELDELDDRLTDRQDFLSSLTGRLHAAFAAHRVLAFSVAEADSDKLPGAAPGVKTSEAGYTIRACYGAALPDAEHPSLALLRQGMDIGFLEAPDGTLLVRVRPPQPGSRPYLLFIEPGKDRVYDPLAQAVVRSLLFPVSG